ncbi:MAG: M23 family metallopeptidase [Firmicutes bacterium]|nr:M23 family metallopeptidase [Bacillota bacterium]
MRKFIIICIISVCTISMFLFINVNNVNRDEEFYTSTIPPDIELTDGTHSVKGSIKTGNWYYRGKNNKFYPFPDDNAIISENKDVLYNLDDKPEVLFYNGNLILKCSHNPDKLNLQIFKKNNLIFQEDSIVLENGLSESECPLSGYSIFQPKEEGELLYKITAFWYESGSADRGFYGEAIYEFAFVNDVPIEFEVSSSQTFPGELLTIFAKYANEDEDIFLKSDLAKSDLPFYKYEHGKFAILPLSYDLKPSDYIVSLTAENVNLINKKESYEITISVLPKEFPIQYLTISEEVDQSTRNDAAYEEYNKYIGAVRKTDTPVKMWDGVFLKPVEGRITTEFGMRRFVNNAPTSYRHSGIDIAADIGTPVKATNSGKVILARHLILTGNTVLIDHGYGIISWNYHMDSIAVKEGDDLIKGQIIGEVGSTGFSTGPHLHFAISVHDVFTNPWTLFEQEPVLFK